MWERYSFRAVSGRQELLLLFLLNFVLVVDKWHDYGFIRPSRPVCWVSKSAVCALYVVLCLRVGWSFLPCHCSVYTARPWTDGEVNKGYVTFFVLCVVVVTAVVIAVVYEMTCCVSSGTLNRTVNVKNGHFIKTCKDRCWATHIVQQKLISPQ